MIAVEDYRHETHLRQFRQMEHQKVTLPSSHQPKLIGKAKIKMSPLTLEALNYFPQQRHYEHPGAKKPAQLHFN